MKERIKKHKLTNFCENWLHLKKAILDLLPEGEIREGKQLKIVKFEHFSTVFLLGSPSGSKSRSFFSCSQFSQKLVCLRFLVPTFTWQFFQEAILRKAMCLTKVPRQHRFQLKVQLPKSPSQFLRTEEFFKNCIGKKFLNDPKIVNPCQKAKN